MSDAAAGPTAQPTNPDPDPPHPGGRREAAVVLLVAAVSAAVVLLAAGRAWLDLAAQRQAPLAPLSRQVSGRTLHPALSGLAVVALLAVVLILVTGRWLRSLFAVLLLLASAAMVWLSVGTFASPSRARVLDLLGDRGQLVSGQLSTHLAPAWPVISLAAAVLLAVAALVAALRCRGWNLGLSARYAAPADAARMGDPWRAMDRGDDPTVNDR